jgi:hypothetical protein
VHRVFGPRTVVETTFLVAGPVVSLAAGLSAVEPPPSRKEQRKPPGGEPEPEPVPAPQPVPQPDPEPQPEVEPMRILHPVPDPEPEPEEPGAGPDPEEPEPAPAASDDAGRDEERTFLLTSLRDFAGPDGLLPVDFDGLVRDSLGRLVGAR